MKDYTIICSCGFEVYTKTLLEAKKSGMSHLKGKTEHEIYIDRNIDGEIDDSFKSVILKSKTN